MGIRSRYLDERRITNHSAPFGFQLVSQNTPVEVSQNFRIGSFEHWYLQHGHWHWVDTILDADLWATTSTGVGDVYTKEYCQTEFEGYSRGGFPSVHGRFKSFEDVRKSKVYYPEMPLGELDLTNDSASYSSQSAPPNYIQVRQTDSKIDGGSIPAQGPYRKSIETDSEFAPNMRGKHSENCIFQIYLLIEGAYTRDIDGVKPHRYTLLQEWEPSPPGPYIPYPLMVVPVEPGEDIFDIDCHIYGCYCHNYAIYPTCELTSFGGVNYNDDTAMTKSPRRVHVHATAHVTSNYDDEDGIDPQSNPFELERNSGLESAIADLVEFYYSEEGFPDTDVHKGFAGKYSQQGEGIRVEFYE